MHQINHATVLAIFVGIFSQNKFKHYPFSQIKAWNLCCANLCNKGFHAHLQQRYMTLLCLWNDIFNNSSFELTGMPGGKPVALHTALLNEDEHKQCHTDGIFINVSSMNWSGGKCWPLGQHSSSYTKAHTLLTKCDRPGYTWMMYQGAMV